MGMIEWSEDDYDVIEIRLPHPIRRIKYWLGWVRRCAWRLTHPPIPPIPPTPLEPIQAEMIAALNEAARSRSASPILPAAFQSDEARARKSAERRAKLAETISETRELMLSAARGRDGE